MKITITMRMLAVTLAAILGVAACGEAPEPAAEPTDAEEGTATDGAGGEETEETGDTDFAACEITDAGGVDDRSFNESAFRGLEQAEEELGIEANVLESTNEADYEPNMQAFLDQDCDLIIPVGFLLDEVTQEAAQANEDQLFAIVDVDFFDPEAEEDITYDNVRELTFQTDEAAFLAGYLAAGMTETGKVGTYGGIEIPTVTIFMDGFLAGVRHHNQEKDTDVEVVGWDGQDGSFTGNFDSQDDGRALTDQMLSDDADIIMPVAGPVGLGSAAAIEEAGEGLLIWVDSDGFESASQFGELMLTSVVKNIDVAVFDIVERTLEDDFEGGLYTGTLENDGVGLAPYHDLSDEVPDELDAEITELREEIIAGELSVDPEEYS